MLQKLLTVAICTHNRPDDLAQCLAALMPQFNMRMQVVVCDSGSSPENREAVAKVVAAYPLVELVCLETSGLALARNALLARAAGVWFAILDDDAVPADDWVKVALDLADRVPGEYAVVGGAVHPIMPSDAAAGGVNRAGMGPRWLQLCSAVETCGEFDQTANPRVVGANMWFRAEPLRQVGGFPENLGRNSASLLSGEEKVPVQRLIDGGWRVWYCGHMQVGHRLHRERLTRSWVKRRSYWDGITDRRIARIQQLKLRRGHSLRVAMKLTLLAPLYYVPSVRHEFFLRFWYALGWTTETLRSPRATVE